MERERKRKTGEVNAGGSCVRRRKEAEKLKSVASTEDEVEEFFAILRRMHVVIKSNVDVDGHEMTVKLKASLGKEVLEVAAAAVVVIDDDECSVKKMSIGVWDLDEIHWELLEERKIDN